MRLLLRPNPLSWVPVNDHPLNNTMVKLLCVLWIEGANSSRFIATLFSPSCSSWQKGYTDLLKISQSRERIRLCRKSLLSLAQNSLRLTLLFEYSHGYIFPLFFWLYVWSGLKITIRKKQTKIDYSQQCIKRNYTAFLKLWNKLPGTFVLVWQQHWSDMQKLRLRNFQRINNNFFLQKIHGPNFQCV